MARPLNAVWAAARAGVRRRRLQTASIGVVVALSTATLLFGFGLLAASDSLFDDAFARARGAQATAAFDAAEAPPARVAATARAAGVTAAGPFRTAVLRQARVSAGMPGPGQDLLVAGRADPGGPVDRLTITSGRWVRGPGEIVLHGRPDGPLRVGGTLSSPGLPELTIVGFAVSVTGTADGWVAPAQIGALRPDGLQMLYRFARAGDSPQVQRSLAEATAGLPVAGNTSYVTVRQAFQERFNQLIPFITVFGALAMAVSAVIIGTVVSGAVVAGFRHIGVLKALGFTPAQVTAVYVAMVMTPALAGCAAGVAAGHLLTDAMAGGIARGFELPSAGGATLLLDAAAGGCVVVLVALAALGPALRAGRLPAVQAISAGAVSRRGRGRGPQRWLARTRLPATVALGLGLPVARPARTALTLAALCLGVTAAPLGLGLHQTVSKIATADAEGRTPGAGLAWCYRPLARFVPDDLPLYGLQAAGLDGGAPAASVREMAADYVEQIRAVQPTGPYHLLGFSFGGVPVHEIAVQLQAAGETVAALVVMDAYPFVDRDGAQPPAPLPEPGDHPAPVETDPETDLRRTAERFRAEVGEVLGGISDEELMLVAKIFHNNTALRRRHRPGVFDGDMLLFTAGEHADGNAPDPGRWEPYVRGEITVVGLPCRHTDMVRSDMLRAAWQAIAEWLESRG